jgi:hypothetical protein
MANTKFIKIVILILAIMLLLPGCGLKKNAKDYPQYVLYRPSKIYFSIGNERKATFEPNSTQYEALFTAIKRTWFYPGMLSKNNGDFAKIQKMMHEDSIKENAPNVWFQYDEPVIWTDAFDPENIQKLQIRYYTFLPEYVNSECNTSLIVSESEDIYNKNNVYVYNLDTQAMSLIRDIQASINLTQPGPSQTTRPTTGQPIVQPTVQITVPSEAPSQSIESTQTGIEGRALVDLFFDRLFLS